MTAARPDWAGHYECVECKERIDFIREDGFPAEWTFEVYHDHEQKGGPLDGRWVAALYRSPKRRRVPEYVKAIRSDKVLQKGRAREAAKVLKGNAAYKRPEELA
jgi:hypothetical protein